MKITPWTTTVVLLLLALPGQVSAQSAFERARLESYRWVVVLARDLVGTARVEVGSARNRTLDEQPLPLESSFERDYGPVDRERYSSIADARVLAAESSSATSMALLAAAEARLVALEGSSATALKTSSEAYSAIADVHGIATEQLAEIVRIHKDGPPFSTVGSLRHENLAASSVDVARAWTMASLAALAAERANAILDAMNDGEELPSELLEPLPTDLFKTVA